MNFNTISINSHGDNKITRYKKYHQNLLITDIFLTNNIKQTYIISIKFEKKNAIHEKSNAHR